MDIIMTAFEEFEIQSSSSTRNRGSASRLSVECSSLPLVGDSRGIIGTDNVILGLAIPSPSDVDIRLIV